MKFSKFGIYLILTLIFFGCAKEENFNNTSTEVGISKVVFFPILSTKGDRLVILQPGATYTEQGATATLNNQPTQFTTTGTVDVSKPGIYSIAYEAKNEQGFSATDFRTVVVIASNVDANNFSGTYARHVGGAPNGQTSTWTKIANGVYTVVNPGGATGVTATAVNYTGNLIAIPPQITEAGLFSSAITSTSGIYYPTANPPKYDWAIVNPGYGTALRTFVKQ